MTIILLLEFLLERLLNLINLIRPLDIYYLLIDFKAALRHEFSSLPTRKRVIIIPAFPTNFARSSDIDTYELCEPTGK